MGEGQFQAAGAGCREIRCHKYSKRAKGTGLSTVATLAEDGELQGGVTPKGSVRLCHPPYQVTVPGFG